MWVKRPFLAAILGNQIDALLNHQDTAHSSDEAVNARNDHCTRHTIFIDSLGYAFNPLTMVNDVPSSCTRANPARSYSRTAGLPTDTLKLTER